MGRPLFPTFDRTKEMVGSAFNALTSGSNPAMMAGSAGVNPFASANVPEFPSRLGPLIRTDYGLPPSERPEFRNPADQWDAKPVTARTAAITAPQPAAPSLAPTFPNTGMGIMGNQNVGPLPIEQFSPMTRMAPTLADRGNVTTDITGMQGKVPIQTPYGTIYATAGQAQTQRVSEMGGLPAQSARLANIGEQAQRNAAINQMRERGTALAQQRLGAQEAFFAQRRAERGALAVAESAARASGVRPMDIMRARENVAGPSSIAGIQRQSTIGPMSPVPTTVARFAGALPPAGARTPVASMSPYSNERSERRRRTRRVAEGQGMQPAYSLPIQEAQEDYFRRRGMI